MAAKGLDALLLYGSGHSRAIHYLSNWLTTWEAHMLFPEAGGGSLFVQLSNHVETARHMAVIDDVRFGGRRADGGPSSIQAVVDELTSAGLAAARVGVVGPLPLQHYRAVREALPGMQLIDFSSEMTAQLQHKSAEELARVRSAAELSDGSVAALQAQVVPGMSEFEIAQVIEDAYLSRRGTNGIHYFLTTPMDSPSVAIPRQFPTSRCVQRGDVLVVEISTDLFGYSGQVLRTFSVGTGPTAQYRTLHEVAVEAFERTREILRPGATVGDVLAAADVVHARGLTVGDDFLHGANQLPPIVRTEQTGLGHDTGFTFEEGMCLVIQPNVMTLDGTAGVQYGEMFCIGEKEVQRLHTAEEGFLRCG